MAFKLDKKKKESIKLINIPYDEISYDIIFKISKTFDVSISDIIDKYDDGTMMLTRNEKVFSEFLLTEWGTSKGFSKKNKPETVESLLWLDFVFIQDTYNVMRGIDENGKAYYVYYDR